MEPDPRGDFSPGEPLVLLRLQGAIAERQFNDADGAQVAAALTAVLIEDEEIKDLMRRRTNQADPPLKFETVGVDRARLAGREGIQDFCSVFRRKDSGRAEALCRLRLAKEYLVHTPENNDLLAACIKSLNQQDNIQIPGVGRVELVMPDFVMTSTDHGSGSSGGGPGAPPQAITQAQLQGVMAHLASQPDPPDTAWPFHIRFTGQAKNGQAVRSLVRQTRYGQDVIVLVFDTAPDKARIEGRSGDNALIQSLSQTLFQSGRNGIREFKELPQTTLRAPDDGKHYDMTDHGLFVAGLIHDIAPRAEIQLWRVLNEQGAGNLSTLLDALAEALILAQERETPVIINLSLVINMPVEAIQSQWGNRFHARFDRALDAVFAHHLDTQCIAIAAAGNGSLNQHGAGRRNPRYPARFEPVLAVAAADGAGLPALYSDQGNDPITSPNGVATFGGGVVLPTANQPVIGSRTLANGVVIPDAPIGLVSSALVPEGRVTPGEGPQLANETGWAAWAGTSFATPIVSGLAACLLSGPEASGGLRARQTNQIIRRIMDLAADNQPSGALKVDGLQSSQL